MSRCKNRFKKLDTDVLKHAELLSSNVEEFYFLFLLLTLFTKQISVGKHERNVKMSLFQILPVSSTFWLFLVLDTVTDTQRRDMT